MNLTKEERDSVISIIKNNVSNKVRVFFFGSRMDGTSSKSSDLDVLLHGNSPIELGQISIIKEQLEQSNLPFKVDVLDYHRCSEQMLKNIAGNLIEV